MSCLSNPPRTPFCTLRAKWYFLVLYTFTLSLSVFFPSYAGAEYIGTFSSDIDVHADGTFSVVETIDYTFTEPRHGIFRTIPLIHPEPARAPYMERVIDVSDVQVSLDGNGVPFTLEDDHDAVTIRVGDPDRTLDGDHTYTIAYVVRGGISYPTYGGAELYWNVTGNDWSVPMKRVVATVSTDGPIFRAERSCYMGMTGETASCDHVSTEGEKIVFSAVNLRPHDGVTVAQAIERSSIERVELTRVKWVWIIVLVGTIGLAYVVYRLYAHETRWKTGRALVPQYEPYPGVKPMYTGILFDGRLDSRDITACIVYLAQSGYIKIRRLEKKVLFLFEVDDYEVELVRVPGETVNRFERDILALLFGDGSTVVGARVSLGELKKNVGVQRANQKLLTTLRSDLRADLEANGFFEAFSWKKLGAIAGVGIVVPVVLLMWVESEEVVALSVFIVLGSLISLAVLARRRTQKGYEALDHLIGFKMFLEMTERDRYAFHNAPAKSPTQFMEFLPYAIAFDVEKEWAAVFKDMTIPQPDWYDGGSVHPFSAGSFAESVGAFSGALASSSGSSAASGGGSSGGGAGGGGGGSW